MISDHVNKFYHYLRIGVINIVLIVISVLAVFILLEGMLRLVGIEKKPARFSCYDPVIGTVVCPNVTGKITSSTGAFTTISSTNSAGIFDQEYPQARPEQVLYRVVLLGDSQTALEYLPREQRFEDMWEKNLPQTMGKPVEIINFGAGGAGTWDQLQIFHLKAAQYRPDLVVLAFNWGNDIRDNADRSYSGKLNPLRDEYPASSFALQMEVARRNFNKWLWNQSLAYQFTHTRYRQLEESVKYYFRPNYMKEKHRTESQIHYNSQDKQQNYLADPAQPDPMLLKEMSDTESIYDDHYFWDSLGWQVTRQLLLKLKKEVEAVGGRLVVFHFPAHGQVMSPLPLPVDAFRQFLVANDIPATDFHDIFRAMPGKEFGHLHIPGDGHFTPEGVQVVYRGTILFLRDQLRALRP